MNLLIFCGLTLAILELSFAATQTSSNEHNVSTSLSEESNGLATGHHMGKAKRKSRPTKEEARNRLIVEYLDTPDNGVSNFQKAKEKADDHLAYLHEKQIQYLRDYRGRKKMEKELGQPLPVQKRTRRSRGKGEHTVEKRIQSKTRAIMRSDHTLKEDQARQFAIKSLQKKRDKWTAVRREKRAKERELLRPEVKIKKPGFYTNEARIKRKADELLRKKNNGVDTLDHAKELAEKYVAEVNDQRVNLSKARRQEGKSKKEKVTA